MLKRRSARAVMCALLAGSSLMMGVEHASATPIGSLSYLPDHPDLYTAPSNLASSPDGSLWFTALPPGGDDPGNVIVRYLPGRDPVVYRIPDSPIGDRKPEGLTVAPDGSVWFTTSSNEIGHLDPSGAWQFFPLFENIRDPTAIAQGPDGNRWFIADYRLPNNTADGFLVTGVICRVTSTGDVTVFREPTWKLALPQSITSGPDGNVWFTVRWDDGAFPDEVGSITPTGAMRTYVVRHLSNPDGITAGPDGKVWVASVANSKIIRIAPRDGAALGTFHAPVVNDLVAGTDGNFWYTDSLSLYRMTPTGVSTKFPVKPATPELKDLVRGSDGALWFISYADSLSRLGMGAIGRLSVQG
jgi:streptogramin lyase